MKLEGDIAAILFDLDGTLADTAPDLAAAVNLTIQEQGYHPAPFEKLRPMASHGVRGLLHAAIGITQADMRYGDLSERVLAHYARNICTHSSVFPGMADVLTQLDARGIRWGIVTNKHSRLTETLVDALQLRRGCACVVSGDTAARPKPAPDPLLHAANHMGIAPSRCIYVGDDKRDIAAGRSAGMLTIAVRWGYLGTDDLIETWDAHGIVDRPEDLLGILPGG